MLPNNEGSLDGLGPTLAPECCEAPTRVLQSHARRLILFSIVDHSSFPLTEGGREGASRRSTYFSLT